MFNINDYVKNILKSNNVNKDKLNDYKILHDTTLIKKYCKLKDDYIETLIIVTPDDCPIYVYNIYFDDYGQCYNTQYYNSNDNNEYNIGLGTYNSDYVEACLGLSHVNIRDFIINKLIDKFKIQIDTYHGDLCIYKDNKRFIIYEQWSIDNMFNSSYSIYTKMEKLIKHHVDLLN